MSPRQATTSSSTTTGRRTPLDAPSRSRASVASFAGASVVSRTTNGSRADSTAWKTAVSRDSHAAPTGDGLSGRERQECRRTNADRASSGRKSAVVRAPERRPTIERAASITRPRSVTSRVAVAIVARTSFRSASTRSLSCVSSSSVRSDMTT
ncbi:MAG TPA: hypothetical protein PKA62_03320 [Thermoanaerobaculia bacterium]|nr:hypothetical protein [Thermoanaerobaculia bacterium]